MFSLGLKGQGQRIVVGLLFSLMLFMSLHVLWAATGGYSDPSGGICQV
jgi:hypothetical protein